MRVHVRKPFCYGSGVAVRLPKEFGIKPGTRFEVERRGDAVVLRELHEAVSSEGSQ
jgi:virulence-associated protein VagC